MIDGRFQTRTELMSKSAMEATPYRAVWARGRIGTDGPLQPLRRREGCGCGTGSEAPRRKRPPPAPLRPRCRSRGAESSVVARGSGRIAMAADLLRQGGRHPGIAAVRWSSASPATADLSAPRDRHPPPQRFAAEHLFSMHPEGESLAAHNDRKETSTRTPSCLPGRLPIPIAGRARNEGLSTPWTVQRTTRRAFPRVARSARSLSARQRRGESRVARVKRRRLESRNRGSDEGRGPKTVFSNSKPREETRPVLKDEFVPGEGHKEARLRLKGRS
jgi:hypothetical protein